MANLHANSLHKYPHIAAFDKITEAAPNLVPLDELFVYMIDSVPASALPFLAEQFDVLGYKGWRFADTEQKQRNLIKKAIELHRYKGTPWSIKEALKIIGFENTIIHERLPGNNYNGDWNHNGVIYYNSPHWATFRVIIDATLYGVLTAEQTADVIALVNEYKNARSKLVDVSMGYHFSDTVTYSEVLTLPTESGAEEDLSLVNYNGVFTYDGIALHDGENDILDITIINV